MKLLIEQSFDVEPLTEQTTNGLQLYIEGIFLQSNKINRNRRLYEREKIMLPAVDKYIKEYVNENRAIGELTHPEYPVPKLEEAALRTVELSWDGDNVRGKALVLNTPKGNILRGLIEGGFKMGMSSRSLGSLKEEKDYSRVTSLIINAIDAVDMPSGPECYVDPINESVNWVQNQVGIWMKESVQGQNVVINTDMFNQYVRDAVKRLKADRH